MYLFYKVAQVATCPSLPPPPQTTKVSDSRFIDSWTKNCQLIRNNFAVSSIADPTLPPPGFHLASYVVAVFLFLFVVALGVVWCYATAPRKPSLEESQTPRNSDHDHLLSVSSHATHLNTTVCQMKDRPKRRSAVVRFVRYITLRREQIFPHGISSTSLYR